MIDRSNRDKLIISIQSFLNDELNSFEFDENIFEIQTNSEDETIKYVVNALWFHYDDIKEHKIAIDKESWDFIQRLILILTSNKEIIETKEEKYTIRQILSLSFLTIFIISYFYVGYSISLLYISMGLGIFSMLLSWWKIRSKKNNLTKWELYPFSSIHELSLVRRKQQSFQKKHYYKKLEKRNIRSCFTHNLLLIQSRLSWLVFSPFVLLYQSLPETDTNIKLK